MSLDLPRVNDQVLHDKPTLTFHLPKPLDASSTVYQHNSGI